jgi:hypothetical protein
MPTIVAIWLFSAWPAIFGDREVKEGRNDEGHGARLAKF